MTGTDPLSRRQDRAVHALLTARTVHEAAVQAGVSERTLRRWRAQPGFAASVRDAGRDLSRSATAALLGARLEAVSVLRTAMVDGDPSIRVRAAGLVLEHGRHALADDTAERLDQVEGRLDEWEPLNDGWPWPRSV